MGETGENTDEWIAAWTRLMIKNNIGYHYWPYKKMGSPRCMVTIPTPENWDVIVDFAEGPRETYEAVQANRPNQEQVKRVMMEYIANLKLAKCTINEGYIRAMAMEP
jgi:hypothetical protein